MTTKLPRVLVLLLSSIVSSSSGPFNPRQELESKDGPFISRPDLHPPSYTVSQNDPLAVSQGYWFVAPYQDPAKVADSAEPLPCSIGPHIFDNAGQLVWSGACQVENNNFFDFKTVEYDSKQYLTGLRSDLTVKDGPAIIFDNTYDVIQHTSPGENASVPNTYTFTLYNRGSQALFLTSIDEQVNETLPANNGGGSEIEPRDDVIRQIEVKRGLVLQEWRALDVLEASESLRPRPVRLSNEDRQIWDWLQASSLQKLSHPMQVLLSGRFTDTIYKISLEQDAVMWRLGGPHSTFTCDGFIFSRQNEAQILSEDQNKVIMTIFNNAADDRESFANHSAGYLVEIDITASRATLLREFTRPDRGFSRSGGNMQRLDNGNMFIFWGERGYITEFGDDGRVVLEAAWSEPHLNTYRAYKFNFTGYPTEPIALKCFADSGKTNCFVSWNGATEVDSWEFWQLAEQSDKHSLGRAQKDGFETVVSMEGLLRTLAVKALDAEGKLLGWSTAIETVFQGERHPDPGNVVQGSVQDVKPPEPQYEGLVHHYWTANSGWTWTVFVACLFAVALILEKFYRFRPAALNKKKQQQQRADTPS